MSKRYLVIFVISFYIVSSGAIYASEVNDFSPFTTLGIKEGDVIGSEDPTDPDLYIINQHGLKRLFLNPKIFSLYGHLGYATVQRLPSDIISAIQTSPFFRNCEKNDSKIYVLEVTGEDSGKLHWLNITSGAAKAAFPDFEKMIFCINNLEFNLYGQGEAYTNSFQVPAYARYTPTPLPVPEIKSVAPAIFSEKWLFYKNVKYGISFRYPEDWASTSFAEEGILLMSSEKTYQKEYYDFMFSVDENKESLNPRDFWGKLLPQENADYSNFSGYPAIKVTGPYGYSLVVQKDNRMLVFSSASWLGMSTFETLLSKIQLDI